MNRRSILKWFTALPSLVAGSIDCFASVRQSFTWQHWSVVPLWPVKGERLHICVREETRQLSCARLIADDPVWSNGSRVTYHGPFIEHVTLRPLPDRFIGWIGDIDNSAAEIAVQRDQRIAAVRKTMA